MDPRRNPYAPGAGTPPPELAGRDEIIDRAAIALDRIRGKKSARSLILYGLRGVGKTVLLNKIRIEAESRGIFTVSIEAPENRSLPGILVPPLRSLLIKLSLGKKVRAKLASAMRALGGFANSMKVKYEDVEVGFDFPTQRGLADSGDLEADLVDLFGEIGRAAQEAETAVVIFLDEIQYVPEEHLAALISALHRAGQDQLPITVMAAGLPQILAQTGKAKSYAERLFEFVSIDALEPEAARDALRKPAQEEGVAYTNQAVEEILVQTKGYPYFLQEWGKHTWNLAEKSPIEGSVAKRATVSAIAELDASFFRVRFDRMTPAEKVFLRAMAELGPGPHRSGEIAKQMGKQVTAVAPTRNSLIAKGIIYSPQHGDTAFTVPLFDGFLKRTMEMAKAEKVKPATPGMGK